MGETCNHQCDSCGSNGNCSTQDLEHEKRVKEHTSGVKNVIAVVGGKGGVGKSLVTSLLAIQTQRLGYHAAILDADITGPSIPKIFGINKPAEAVDNSLLPHVTESGVKIMSMNMLLPNATDPVLWRGPVISGPKRRRIIGDRKQLLVTEKAKLKEELFSKIQVGDKVEGTVKNVTDFGAFIDLGGADGLLHISEMSWGRVENPKKVFKSGDKVTVLIKDIQGEKIALSLKFPEANPWAHAAEKYAAGSVVTGRVARMTDFGAFVELEPGVDALLHVSQISREHIEKPADVLKIGQEIEAKVVDFNEDDHKISLSVKALQAAPQNEDVADVDIDSYAK